LPADDNSHGELHQGIAPQADAEGAEAPSMSTPPSVRPLSDRERAEQILRLMLLSGLKRLAQAGLDLRQVAGVEVALLDGCGIRLRAGLESGAGLSFLSPTVTNTGGDNGDNPARDGDNREAEGATPSALERIRQAVLALLDDVYRKPAYFADKLELSRDDSRIRRALAALKRAGLAENPRGRGYRRPQGSGR